MCFNIDSNHNDNNSNRSSDFYPLPGDLLAQAGPLAGTANLRSKILDFRVFDSIRILSRRCGILMSVGSVQKF